MENYIALLLVFMLLALVYYHKEIISAIRNGTTTKPTKFERLHYKKFEDALRDHDIEAYVYEEHGLKGQVICLRGEELHAVTEQNLVSFRKLNRKDSRYLRRSHGIDLHENKIR